MTEIAIKNICNRLSNEYNIQLNDKVALDFFAREGSWQTQYYASKVKKIYAWEVDSKYEQNLRYNLPDTADITIGDSFVLAKQQDVSFDLIVLDNPQGCFGEDNRYCEHFEALDICLNLLKSPSGILIFNIKTTPFNYTDKIEWQKRRNAFYSVTDTSHLTKEFIFNFYETFFKTHGFITEFAFLEERPQESGLYALTVQLTINEFN